MPISRLSDDAMGHVMQHMDLRTLGRAVRTCRSWNRVAEASGQWLARLKQVCPKERMPVLAPGADRMDPAFIKERLREETQLAVNFKRSAYHSTRLTGAAAQVSSLALNADGEKVVAPSYQGALGRWEVAGAALPAQVDAGHAGTIVAQSSDTTTVVYETSNRFINTHSLTVVRAGIVVRTWAVPFGQSVRVTLSPTGEAAAVGMQDGSLWVGRSAQDDALMQAAGTSDAVVAHSAISANNQTLAGVVFADRCVKVWDMQNPSSVRVLANLPALEVAFSADNETLAILGCGGRVYTADLRSPTLVPLALPQLNRRAITQAPSALQFSADGHWLFVLAGRSIWVWDLMHPTRPAFPIKPTAATTDVPTALAVSADAHRFLVELEFVGRMRPVTRLEVWDFGPRMRVQPAR